MLNVLACADFIVLPTREDCLGIALMEGAAAGLPAISTRMMGIPEVVVHERTGLLIPPDGSGLLDALRRLLNHPEMRVQFGLAARDLATREWHEDAVRDSLAGIYQSVAVSNNPSRG
jgi:glycosyltransferase involved in cell wall biosynthesis